MDFLVPPSLFGSKFVHKQNYSYNAVMKLMLSQSTQLEIQLWNGSGYYHLGSIYQFSKSFISKQFYKSFHYNYMSKLSWKERLKFTYPKYPSADIDRKLRESLIFLHFFLGVPPINCFIPPHLPFSSSLPSFFYLLSLWFTSIYLIPSNCHFLFSSIVSVIFLSSFP